MLKLQPSKRFSSLLQCFSRPSVNGQQFSVVREERVSTLGPYRHYDARSEEFHYVDLLKMCAKKKDLTKGIEIHVHVAACRFLEHNVFLGSALISMYANCGAVEKAQQVFDELPICNEVTWNALIAAYGQQGRYKEALNCFECMQSRGFYPDAFTYSCSLKCCSNLKILGKGHEIHAQIVRLTLLETDSVLASALVDMYIKCGALEKAQQVFDELPFQDRFVWTALIAGYSEHGLGAKAITMYEQMQSKGFALDAVTFICVLQACANIQNCTKGEEIHVQIVKMHFLDKDRSVGTALVDMYAKCGSYDKALEVFDYINTRDTILWNAVITACAQLEYAEEAWKFFQQMQLESFCPTNVTFACVLKACSNLKAQAKGQEIHARIVKDHSQEHVVLGNALIDMYSKCGALMKAQKVFDELSFRDRISWTALIVGYVQHGYGEEAISWFEHMQSQGFFADTVTLSCTLKACGSIGALNKGEEIHALIKREQFLGADITVINALIYMYAKCGAVEKAYEVFDGLPTKNVVSWNIIIALNAQCGCSEEVMLHFKQMQHEGFSPDSITFISMLKACSVVGAAYLGQNLHDKIVSVGSFDKAAVANALVTMYSSCGMLIEAHDLFNKVQDKDLALLSTLMLGYSLLGDDQSVFRLFDNLIEVNMEPNSVVFTILFNTCSHTGLVDEGKICLELIHKVYGIIPTIEHYSCLVDLLCRACCLAEAAFIVNEIPLYPDVSMWNTVLGACQKWGSLDLGNWAFQHAMEMDDRDAATYVSMSNVLVAASKLEDGALDGWDSGMLL